MASEYFLEPEINLVTENTENILSEGGRDGAQATRGFVGKVLAKLRARRGVWSNQGCGLFEGPVSRGPS